MPGRDGAEERGWDRRGRGAQAGVGGPRRAPPETECRAPAPGLVEAEPRGPHLTRSSPGRNPGSPGGRRKCSVTPRPAQIPPPAGALGEPRDAGCGHHESRDWSPLEVKLRSSRASAGRSRGQSAGSPPPAVHTTCPLSPGTRRAAGRFGRGTSGTRWPPARVTSRGEGDVPLAPSSSWMAPPTE